MNGKKVVSLVFPVANKIVSDLGYVLVDMEYRKSATGMVLELFIDGPNGITLTDCEKVSKSLDKPLDDLNPTNDEPYNLNVSSLGLDRPLTTEYQLNKYKNQLVEVKFYEPLKPYNKKQVVAKLVDWDELKFTLEIDSSVVEVAKTNIAQMVPYIEF